MNLSPDLVDEMIARGAVLGPKAAFPDARMPQDVPLPADDPPAGPKGDRPAAAQQILLPWPPSINHYWRHVIIKGSARVLISKEGREYRRRAGNCVAVSGARPMEGRLMVHIDAHPPDRRARDLDNLLKPILDVLQHAGVYKDDSAIDCLTINRSRMSNVGGTVEVTLSVLSRPVEEQP
jgi:crossover junction endodeoxyribonuclease RusA